MVFDFYLEAPIWPHLAKVIISGRSHLLMFHNHVQEDFTTLYDTP